MHEASIAQSILEIAINECLKAGASRIDRIKVEIGIMNTVSNASLLFAFNASKINTIAEDAELDIIEKPAGGFCRDCGQRFITEQLLLLNCPICGGKDFIIDQGRELNIIELEVSGETEGSKKHT
ncbi:MAG: hydrogenase maturation nickel metallochaperone HypA [Thermodesulfovibrionales bacterium]